MSYSQKSQTRVGQNAKAPVNHNIMEATWLAGYNLTQVARVSQFKHVICSLADLLTAHATGDLDCCLDILIHVAQRLRDTEEVSKEELAAAAKRVSDALSKEVR